MYGTSDAKGSTGNIIAQGCEDEDRKWDLEPQVVDINGVETSVIGLTFNETTGPSAPAETTWDLNYCCAEHFCTGSANTNLAPPLARLMSMSLIATLVGIIIF